MKKKNNVLWFLLWNILLFLFITWTGLWPFLLVELLLVDRYFTHLSARLWRKLGTAQKSWCKFLVTLALWLVFLLWVRSAWGLLVVPFLFDAYITKKIPWYWWKKSKNATIRVVMSWVDAIAFALVAAFFVTQFFAQNFVIPSSSLEKSLLVGDYLLVSKMSYGPRIPNTPLSVPLTAHTLPVVGCKSFIEWPQWAYRRVKGLGQVQLGDIVVFNYPCGDTVALKRQNEDFYGLCYQKGAELGYDARSLLTLGDSAVSPEMWRKAYAQQYQEGFRHIRNHPEEFGKISTRPVDRRENYVKRCVGLPGQTLQIKDRIIYLDGKAEKEPEEVQYCYFVQFIATPPVDLLKELGISVEDLEEMVTPENPGLRYMPLTRKAVQTLKNRKDLVESIQLAPAFESTLFPQNKYKQWTCHNYGPVWIPKKGATIPLSLDNLPLYERAIRTYERNLLEVRGKDIYINGKKSSSYTFQMDYYFMMGDNRDRSADSRFWGFVPEDHIVGTPLFVWLSLDKDYGWFDGKIRWERLFRWVSDIK